MLDFRHQRSRPSASAVYPCGGPQTLSAPVALRRARSARICAVRTWRDPEVIKRLLTTPATGPLSACPPTPSAPRTALANICATGSA
jgi:hypothetical protein